MSIDNTTLDIDLDELPGVREIGPAPDDAPYAGAKLSFALCSRNVQLGDLTFRQWWLSQRGLYGERNQNSANRLATIECFWNLCFRDGSAHEERDVRQSYILAHLLPHARSNGSRKVFVDASLTRNENEESLDRQATLVQLQEMLRSARDDRVTVPDFYTRTRDVLGPPEYDEDVWTHYRQLEEDLLGETHEAWEDAGQAALDRALQTWAEKMRKIGRRSGNTRAKQALDILSYECRAAFHRCYSAAWHYVLLDAISDKKPLSQEAVHFHRLWHLDQVIRSNETPEADFHLFHGHVFALHPAAGDLICTETGRELIGELLSDPSDNDRHQRFLNAMLIAIHHYAVRYDVARELRTRQPQTASDGDIGSVVVDALSVDPDDSREGSVAPRTVSNYR